MTEPGKNTDYITKKLLQKATVQKPSEAFTSHVMKMIEEEKEAAEGAPAESPERTDNPWGFFIFSGIYLTLLGGLSFLILSRALSDTAFGRNIMNMLSILPVDNLRILYVTLKEYYLIPVVINLTCLLIILDLILRKKNYKGTGGQTDELKSGLKIQDC